MVTPLVGRCNCRKCRLRAWELGSSLRIDSCAGILNIWSIFSTSAPPTVPPSLIFCESVVVEQTHGKVTSNTTPTTDWRATSGSWTLWRLIQTHKVTQNKTQCLSLVWSSRRTHSLVPQFLGRFPGSYCSWIPDLEMFSSPNWRLVCVISFFFCVCVFCSLFDLFCWLFSHRSILPDPLVSFSLCSCRTRSCASDKKTTTNIYINTFFFFLAASAQFKWAYCARDVQSGRPSTPQLEPLK